LITRYEPGQIGGFIGDENGFEKPHFKEPRIFLAFDPVGPGNMKKNIVFLLIVKLPIKLFLRGTGTTGNTFFKQVARSKFQVHCCLFSLPGSHDTVSYEVSPRPGRCLSLAPV
jgi:hypothetical protein